MFKKHLGSKLASDLGLRLRLWLWSQIIYLSTYLFNSCLWIVADFTFAVATRTAPLRTDPFRTLQWKRAIMLPRRLLYWPCQVTHGGISLALVLQNVCVCYSTLLWYSLCLKLYWMKTILKKKKIRLFFTMLIRNKWIICRPFASTIFCHHDK